MKNAWAFAVESHQYSSWRRGRYEAHYEHRVMSDLFDFIVVHRLILSCWILLCMAHGFVFFSLPNAKLSVFITWLLIPCPVSIILCVPFVVVATANGKCTHRRCINQHFFVSKLELQFAPATVNLIEHSCSFELLLMSGNESLRRDLSTKLWSFEWLPGLELRLLMLENVQCWVHIKIANKSNHKKP